MITGFRYLLTCMLILVSVVSFSQSPVPVPLTGAYLGQTEPGETPVVFAPGLISGTGDRLHGPLTVSPDGHVICWSVIPPAIRYRVQREDGSWSEPMTIPMDVRAPTAAQFAPDGRLWFQGIPKSGGAGSVDLGYVIREDGGWSTPRWPGVAVNSTGMDSTPSVTSNGDVFLTAGKPGKTWNRGLYHIPFRDGYFQPREYLPAPINRGDNCIDYTVFVDPAGRYLIWASSRPTENEADLKLYISHRQNEGGWGEAVNLSEKLGLTHAARFPSVSPDGRFLFFLMGGKIWWVSTVVISPAP